jgi:hypothetical protein
MELSHKKIKCTTFVLAMSQWPSSNQAWDNKDYQRPFSFGKFYEGMSAIVQSPEIHGIHPDVKIYLRTIHLNPLGDWKTECGAEHRPKDWRSPTVIGGYNQVVKQVVKDT